MFNLNMTISARDRRQIDPSDPTSSYSSTLDSSVSSNVNTASTITALQAQGISATEASSVLATSVSTAELLQSGVDPATASPAEIQMATIKIQLGRELGLTPAQIQSVMKSVQDEASTVAAALAAPVSAAQLLQMGVDSATASPGEIQRATVEIQLHGIGLTPGQIQNVMQGVQNTAQVSHSKPVASSDSLQSSSMSGSGAGSSAHMTILVGPPSSTMSIKNFITAISHALEEVMMTKGKVEETDAQMSLQMIKDTNFQTKQRIDFSNANTTKMIEQIKSAINTMRAMRIVEYFVLVLMFIITVIISVLTFGAAAAPMAIAMAAIAAVFAAVALILTIAISERKRKETDHDADNDKGLKAMMVAAIVFNVLSMVLGIGAAIVAISKAMSLAVKAAIEEVTKDSIATVAKLVGQLISEIGAQVGQTLSSIMTMRSMGGSAANEADNAAQSDYEGSDQQKAVNQKAADTISQATRDLANGKINQTQFNTISATANQGAMLQNEQNLSTLKNHYRTDYQAREEKMSNAFLGLTLGLSLTGLFMTLATQSVKMSLQIIEAMQVTIAKDATDFISKLATVLRSPGVTASIQQLVGVIQAMVQIVSSIVEASTEVASETAQISLLEQTMNSRQMVIVLEASEQMWESLQSDIQQLMTDTQKSLTGLIGAMSSLFESFFHAMDKISQSI